MNHELTTRHFHVNIDQRPMVEGLQFESAMGQIEGERLERAKGVVSSTSSSPAEPIDMSLNDLQVIIQ